MCCLTNRVYICHPSVTTSGINFGLACAIIHPKKPQEYEPAKPKSKPAEL